MSEVKDVHKNIDKNSDKYKVALKFINKILSNLGKDNVDDLTKFVDVDRKLLVNDNTKKILSDMTNELHDHFDKVKCGYYRRNKTKDYILTFIRYMCNDIGLSFASTKRDVSQLINGETLRNTHRFYSIK